ncbi:MAG: D-beta-D-heptose 7-phosphate kinase / D-beta-D-heptose 1-phosphate adenosyltransferase [Aliidongia sp.]|jgi:D-beta-D-heptose 7-phosphate kinase/D-beta-D-heptose 1-phosphate adenosyltransferase|nr:D-beta-D-heptose 7-phosphate kinase / D-beta-D-heptose 1-phosphate adenosyltransferase [Aliidongia sp.]
MTAGRAGALADLLIDFSGLCVLVLGDLMVDCWVYGQVERISAEAPIPVLRVEPERQRWTLGGASNVAENVAALGAKAILIGVTGADAAAAEMARLTGAIDTCLVGAVDRPTTLKTRYIAHGQQLLRADQESTAPLDDATATAVLAAFRAKLAQADIVILSDYAKGVLCDPVLSGAIAAAAAAGIPIVADPKRLDFARYRGVTVLKPNRLEASRATGIDCSDNATTEAAGRVALAATEAQAILVTRGEHGLSVIAANEPALHLPTQARRVFDVSGAGDTVIAVFAVALAGGAGLADAARLANVAAGIVVAKPGTATVSRDELADALHVDDLLATDRKIMALDQAVERVAGWRARGLSVGFTNGCFDLIHPGHVALLSRARATCDRLVVALNTDASIQRLKGPDRPIQSEGARATVMASIGAVDLVVPFAEDTPIQLIEALKPDVLIKGADYTIDQVVGADFVQAHGGRVALVPLEQGQSTSRTIARIRTTPIS